MTSIDSTLQCSIITYVYYLLKIILYLFDYFCKIFCINIFTIVIRHKIEMRLNTDLLTLTHYIIKSIIGIFRIIVNAFKVANQLLNISSYYTRDNFLFLGILKRNNRKC